MNSLYRQTLLLTQSQLARNPLPTLMESEDWEHPPTPPPKDARYAAAVDIAAMDGDAGSAPASGSKRKRAAHDFDETVYERRNGQLEAVNGDQDLPTAQKRPRSHAGRRNSNYSDDEFAPAQRFEGGSLRRKRAFGNLSNLNLRHAAASAFRDESPTRESRFQEGSLNDRPSQQPPSVFTRINRTDSGNLQQVDTLMNDYHEDMVAPKDSSDAYVQATIEYEKASMPARVAEITDERKKEASKHGMFKFGKSFTNTFHPVQLWNRMWSESKEELMVRNRLEAERKAREKAEIQARYDQMKRDGLFNTQHVPFAGRGRAGTPPAQDSVMADDVSEVGNHQRIDSFELPRSQSSDTRDAREDPEAAVPTTATKGRFSRLHFKTPSISNLRDTFRSVRSVRSHSALSGAIDRDSSASGSVSPAKADLSTLKKSISRYDLKKERRLSNRVSDLESKLNKARMELKNALDDASPMPRLGGKYERFTPIGTTKRSRFVPGALATLPSERLLFPEMSTLQASSEEQGRDLAIEARPRNTLALNSGMDMSEAFENVYDGDKQDGRTVPVRNKKELTEAAIEVPQPGEVATQDIEVEVETVTVTSNPHNEATIANQPATAALNDKLSALEASYKASKPGRSKKRRSGAADEKSYRPDADEEETSEEDLVPQKKRKSDGKSAGAGKKKLPGSKSGKKTGIPAPVADAKGKKGRKTSKAADKFFTNGGLITDDGDSHDELASAAPAGADSDVPSLEPVYEEEEETTTVPLKDEPSKPTAKSTPARYATDTARPHSSSPHKTRSDSLLPPVVGAVVRSSARSPPPKGRRVESADAPVSAVPGENGVPSMPVGDNTWTWPADVF
ncbi:uncharacterized protein RCC_04813 [Ramularia collo-cygni]|uniref:Uncharacterized protein n=1 Tax=Ramularia collo-cygni TaxID=112498 RepID=A0A2D3UUS5_9PEZI|nr:uncharacterized protein RCC_04813 [Ramularia collo-cygni]CZT18968.1 uncharacterized protein RCC_04813 [Ramularia collo-cygni]